MDVIVLFNDNCVVGIEVDEEVINENVNCLLMFVIVLNLYIGYENVVKIVKYVYKEGLILKEVVL